MVNPEQKQGMSTQTKWLIGCGGCLGVIVIVAIGLSVLAGLGFNALQGASNQSVSQIFGKDFKPAPYMAMGLPLGQKNLKNMVLMMDQKRGVTLFAIDSELTADKAKLVQSADPKNIETFLKGMSEQATSHSSSSSSSRLRDIHFDSTETVTLPNGKRFPISKATMEAERRGQVAYSPAVAALIPEPNNRLITLIALDPNNGSTEPGTDFTKAQDSLQQEMVRIVTESDLDDQLVSTASIPHTASSSTSP